MKFCIKEFFIFYAVIADILVSYGSKYSRLIKAHDSLECNVLRTKGGMKLVLCMQRNNVLRGSFYVLLDSCGYTFAIFISLLRIWSHNKSE